MVFRTARTADKNGSLGSYMRFNHFNDLLAKLSYSDVFHVNCLRFESKTFLSVPDMEVLSLSA